MIRSNFSSITSELEDIGMSKAFMCRPEQCTTYLQHKNKTISIFHLNIRSINNNFDMVRVLFANMEIAPEILIFSECWLSVASFLPDLEGYKSTQTQNNENQNSGIVIYCKDYIDAKIYEPKCIRDAGCLVLEYGKELAVVAIYRSPSHKDADNFIGSLHDLLSALASFQMISILGDINIDIKQDSEDNYKDYYLDLLASHGLLSTHAFITRGQKCLDHVVVKSKLPSTTLVLDTQITDHLPVMLCAHLNGKLQGPPRTRTYIDYNSIHTAISNTDFSPIFSMGDVNDAVNHLISTISNIIKQNTHVIKITRRKNQIKPWITPGLIRCIKNRDNMHRQLRREPENIILKVTYVRYRNFVNKLLKNVKNNYHKKILQDAKSNPKNTWSAVKQISNINKNKSVANRLLALHQDRKVSANKVNQFFANVGKDLADKILNRQRSSSILPTPHRERDSIVLTQVDEQEIELLIMGLRRDSSVGWDGISSRILQTSSQIFIPVVTYICQLALSTGVFPTAFKKAVVTPVFKSGDEDGITNYRPISVLTTLSKILEKVLNKRLVDYLESKNIIAPNQFGFRRGLSTEDAVHCLLNDVVQYLDSQERCLSMFLDLSKAFDTVSIPLLLAKLERIGIRGLPLSIFSDYLRNRTQCVKIGDVISDAVELVFGVPQGSILGPTLFLIYINDLCKLQLQNCHLYTYADDTALVVYGKNWTDTFTNAELALSTIMTWLDSNLLTLNLAKTTYITFSINASTLPSEDEFVLRAHNCQDQSLCTCTVISKTSAAKYLGVYVDQHLKWDKHLTFLKNKIRKLIYIFRNLNSVADLGTLKIVYYALCQSIISYCITAWGGAVKTLLLPVERAQRAVIKVMTKKPLRYPTHKLYSETSLLTVRQVFFSMLLLRKHSQLVYDPTLRRRRRRWDRVCATPTHRTVFAARHFKVLSCIMYNKATKLIRIYPCTKRIAKQKIKEWLLTYNYDNTENLLPNSEIIIT